MPDDKLTPFALRLKPTVKDAAKALQRLGFVYRWEDGVTVESHHFGSINDTLNSVLSEGLRGVEGLIDAEMSETWEPEYKRFHLMMEFLLAHPAASHVLPENLPPGPDRDWLAEVIEQWNEMDEPSTADRAWVTSEYASSQARVHAAIAAKGAIQRARAR